MNNSIHIQIQMIEFWKECRIGYNFIDFGVPFADPSIKLFFSTTSNKQQAATTSNNKQKGIEKY
jgi:hypothetical protein